MEPTREQELTIIDQSQVIIFDTNSTTDQKLAALINLLKAQHLLVDPNE